ncbi:13669_t:CDS:2 [Ambispora leptoticha]|uniref:13669_t:CDS:1 n=1 Tax=Ambispora leptoticha TaxID=144679 RepID=A0A9N9BAD2_9GLOM|nr:13669_t:CDS:2 [Ambispora leptoticha]
MQVESILNFFILTTIGVFVMAFAVSIVWCFLGNGVLWLYDNYIVPACASWKSKRQVSPVGDGRMPVPAIHHQNHYYDGLDEDSHKIGPIIQNTVITVDDVA